MIQSAKDESVRQRFIERLQIIKQQLRTGAKQRQRAA